MMRLGFGLDLPAAGGVASGGTVVGGGDVLFWDDGATALAWDDGATAIEWGGY